MTLESWLAKHPYLQPIAEFHVQVAEAANSLTMSSVQIPNWQAYSEEYKDGIPVLSSSQATTDVVEIQRNLLLLLANLASMPASPEMKREVDQLYAQCREEPVALGRAVATLLDHGDCEFSHPGLFRHLGWTVLARYLVPLVAAFETWRDEEGWFHEYCPVCGSGPCMAQLVGTEPGRRRFLVCGGCRTRWPFKRMSCPFCGAADDHRLSTLVVAGEKHLRIDCCDSCSGYLKTYDGQGSESVLLTDWTTFHLDILAKDRGLQRLADSLYEL